MQALARGPRELCLFTPLAVLWQRLCLSRPETRSKTLRMFIRSRAPAIFALPFVSLCAPALAHPHIFVETGFALHINGSGEITGVDVTWSYDDFYSLLIFEDLLLDNDFDGKLTDAELGQLQGFDLNWQPDFAGDLYLTHGAAPVELGRPEHRATEVRNGRITTRHFRPLPQPIAANGVTLQAYDPTYYTAYTVALGVELASGDCQASITAPDLNQAYTLVEELLYSMPAQDAEDAYPEVGQSFADTIQITCPGT